MDDSGTADDTSSTQSSWKSTLGNSDLEFEALLGDLKLLSDCCGIVKANSSSKIDLSLAICGLLDAEDEADRAIACTRARVVYHRKMMKKLELDCEELIGNVQLSEQDKRGRTYSSRYLIEEDELHIKEAVKKSSEEINQALRWRGLEDDFNFTKRDSVEKEVEHLRERQRSLAKELGKYHGLPANLLDAQAAVSLLKNVPVRII